MHRTRMKLSWVSSESSPGDTIQTYQHQNDSLIGTTSYSVPDTSNSNSDHSRREEASDAFFLVSVVAPLLFCCFAIFICALNSIWKTRRKLEALNQGVRPEQTEYTEFTIDMTTKVDSCVEISSAQISSKEESILL